MSHIFLCIKTAVNFYTTAVCKSTALIHLYFIFDITNLHFDKSFFDSNSPNFIQTIQTNWTSPFSIQPLRFLRGSSAYLRHSLFQLLCSRQEAEAVLQEWPAAKYQVSSGYKQPGQLNQQVLCFLRL